MIKVFFDASVIIAALLSPEGGSAKLSKFSQNKKVAGITSQTVIAEIKKHQTKIKKTAKEIDEFVLSNKFIVREKIKKSEIKEYQGKVDQNDVHLLAGANLTRCQYLVTLDKKHLLKKEIVSRFRSLSILSPKDLLEQLKPH